MKTKLLIIALLFGMACKKDSVTTPDTKGWIPKYKIMVIGNAEKPQFTITYNVPVPGKSQKTDIYYGWDINIYTGSSGSQCYTFIPSTSRKLPFVFYTDTSGSIMSPTGISDCNIKPGEWYILSITSWDVDLNVFPNGITVHTDTLDYIKVQKSHQFSVDFKHY